MLDIDDIQNRLAKFGQSHLLNFYDELDEFERQTFIDDLTIIDFEEINQLFEAAVTSMKTDVEKLDSRMQPIPASKFESEENCKLEILNSYYRRGLEEISESHVGVLLLAGGQGTRLGITYPKGMYSIGLLSGKTLFQIQAERIRRVQHLAEQETRRLGKLTWYIMTSGPTVEPTKHFLREKAYFGLNSDDIVIFQQGLLPCFDFNGKIFLEGKNRISLSPDGNGGVYRALQKSGVLDDMVKRGIRYVHAHSVDNILTKIADPVLIGYCIVKGADCGVKVVKKAYPSEALAVVCQVDEKFQVVEYSEITDKTANLKNCDGDLLFSAGNICNHFFTTNFLRVIADNYESELKLHVVKKKIPFINYQGEQIKPTSPNGIKIEKFIFDVFPFSNNFVTWEVPRCSEFSALKNSDVAKKDCSATARKDLFNLHKLYIEKAGGTVIGNEIEISPLLSYAGEGLEGIVNGKTFICPVHLLDNCEKSITNDLLIVN